MPSWPRTPRRARAFLLGANPGRFMADIYRLARIRLAAQGVTAVHGGGFCTFSETARFYSYRRSSRTGRLASLIWLELICFSQERAGSRTSPGNTATSDSQASPLLQVSPVVQVRRPAPYGLSVGTN